MFGIDVKVPWIVVLLAPRETVVMTGKFCSWFGPVSVSVPSLGVIPIVPRSIPRPLLEKMELPRIELLLPNETRTPGPAPLKAILLPAPGCVPPMMLLLASEIRMPCSWFGNGAVPCALRPMRFP